VLETDTVFATDIVSAALTVRPLWIRIDDTDDQTSFINLNLLEVRIRDAMLQGVSPVRDRMYTFSCEVEPTEVPTLCGEFTLAVKQTALPEKTRHGFLKLYAI
jgi:hypothetical protein